MFCVLVEDTLVHSIECKLYLKFFAKQDFQMLNTWQRLTAKNSIAYMKHVSANSVIKDDLYFTWKF
jgi:hypothetical protein